MNERKNFHKGSIIHSAQNEMKQILFLLVAFIFLVFPPRISAYTDDEEICYSQCAAYKFVWQGDYCYDLFQQQCATGGTSIKDTIKFLKSIKGVLKSGDGVDTVFKAWFVCKPLIENCIVPQLRECRSTCSADDHFYAPDLSVGHPYGYFVYHGVIYNERDHTLTFKVVNSGRGYAWDIGAAAVWGHTRNRDGLVSGGGELFSETIPELIYAGARNGPPKTVGDYIGDFMIEETNFAQYLQGFKSDADNYNVPAVWYKTIPFTPPEGELTKVIFNVDPNQMIDESSELNNTFVLTIDKLPTPPSYKIEDFSQQQENNTLNNFLIDFKVANTGEENGEVTVKIFEGEYSGSSNQTALYTGSGTVQGLHRYGFSTFIMPDVSTDDTYCGKLKHYELVVFDEGKKVDSWEFTLPLYSGSVRGRVEDLFGKAVEGAVVKASTGQQTTTSKTGSYYLKGINQLGEVTITVTHPEFSKNQTKTLNFVIDDPLDPCREGGLTFPHTNFVLQDQDVMFNVTIKDQHGNLLTAHVMATNQDWRFENDVAGTGPLPGMQPGEYFFTITATGYKTIGQTVNAVPNQQNLEFVMEPLSGRLTDGGLTTHAPQLLWQMDRGEEIFAQMSATKDGKLVLLYTTRNQPMTGKLYFLDAMTGNQVKVASPTIATGGQSQSCLDTSYDGNTTALYVHTGTFGMAQETKNYLKLFDNHGNAAGSKDFDAGGGAHECDVSPDGFYVYPDKLLNKGLYTYTRFDIQGVKNSQQAMTYPGLLHFTTGNHVVVGCPSGGGECLQTLNDTVITNLGKLDSVVRKIDSSQDASKIAILTRGKAYLFANGGKVWEKEVDVGGDPLSLSISPGGKFVIYSTRIPIQHGRIYKIFTDNDLDKTVGELQDRDEDVIFVHANDKGLFVATEHGKTIKYYQVGAYAVDYNPATPSPTPSGQQTTNNISYYDNGVWRGLGEVNFYQLLPGRLYMANSTLSLQVMEPLGKITFLEGTIFGTDNYLNPVLLKGQITANFNSAFEIYALKFDRYDLNLFAEKLAAFTAGTLPQPEFFIVKNVHTKYLVKNTENNFSVAVMAGEVSVLGQDILETVTTGRQIQIDGENNIVKSIYLGNWLYFILLAIGLVIGAGLLFFYRKTRIGKLIIVMLRKLFRFLWQVPNFLFRILLKLVKLLLNLAKNLIAWTASSIKAQLTKRASKHNNH